MGTMTELSDDILYNIFVTLPVKFILRCRSVCKVWRRLLRDPDFVRMHTNRHHQSQEKLLFNNCTRSFYSLDYYEKTKGKAVRRDFPIKVRQHFLGSCNGLVWLGIQRGIRDEDWNNVLWNPSTADYKILPDLRPSFLDNYFEGKQLQGLGYCDDYKMLRLTYKCEDPRADVYTLKTNSWKKIIEDVSGDNRKIMYSNPHHTGIALNGCIYWLVLYQFNGRLNQMLLGFDIKREKFTELSSLPPKASRAMNEHLTVIKGCLCISRVFRHGDIVMWRMRELDNKKKEWNNMMTISTQRMLGRKLYDMHKPLCWLMNRKILFYMGRKFAIYDPRSGILEESYHIDGIDGITDWVTFSESLFSPNTYEG